MLITGGTGQLGTAMRRLVPEADFPTRNELDLSAPAGVAAYLERIRPEAIVNCGAYTAVDRAEEEEDLATVVNGQSVGVMARFAADAGIPFVTFSTDYVFDGQATEPYLESHPTDPINAYGRSKLAGEQAALGTHEGALVIRTSWVISGTHPNFVATMLRLAAERDTLSVVADQRGCPTCVEDLAPGALAALRSGATGLLHLTNASETTWHGLASAAIAEAGLEVAVEPIATEDYPTPAKRPAYSVLGSERREGLGIDALPDWRDTLPTIVAGLRSRS
jgi:dTDP-4-dehydrorhamnose reductase